MWICHQLASTKCDELLDFTEQSSEKLCKWHLSNIHPERAGEEFTHELYLLLVKVSPPWGTNFSTFLGCICVGARQGPEMFHAAVSTGHPKARAVWQGRKAGHHRAVPT